MNLQQLRYLREAARRGLNRTVAARVLHTSQPGLSKAIRELEDELGVQIFVRHGRRLTAITDDGRRVLAIAERLLTEAENLRAVRRELAGAEGGVLRLAATHTQARYVLPPAVARLR
jgi:DNA-binding transcriptional LysR family regulator